MERSFSWRECFSSFFRSKNGTQGWLSNVQCHWDSISNKNELYLAVCRDSYHRTISSASELCNLYLLFFQRVWLGQAPLLTCPQVRLLYGIFKSSLFSKLGLNSEAGGEVKEGTCVSHPSALQPEEQFDYVPIFLFFYTFVWYSEQKIHQIINWQRVMSAFISVQFELEGFGVPFTW